MTPLLIAAVVLLALAVVALAATHLRYRRRRTREPSASTRRILFPFTAHALSQPALDAALRLARAEGATLVPVFLTRVPLQLPLEAPQARQCDMALQLLETIEQRAGAFRVAVDARIERGRDDRHALREMMEHETYDRAVIAAATGQADGFDADDITWFLDHAPGEIVVLRPDREADIEHAAEPTPARHRAAPPLVGTGR